MRKLERTLVAKVGTFVFAAVLSLPVIISPSSAQTRVMVASAIDDALVPAIAISVALELPEPDLPFARARSISTDGAPAMAPAIVPAPAAPPPADPLVLDGFVLASWYGPGFFGNRTACGQTYTAEMLGVAHRTLPCGTRIRITSPAGVTLDVPVIDRGPFVAGRALDLSSATKAALVCGDLCRVRMTVLP